jgi:hypothetical protein
MGNISNLWGIEDYINARDAFLSESQWVQLQVIYRKWGGWEKKNADVTPLEQFNVPRYYTRAEYLWLNSVKVYDTVKGGYFTTGDLDVNSFFQLRGYTDGYVLPNGKIIKEYGGDQIIWNGKLWVVSDQVEPVQFGILPQAVYWRSVLRAVQRTGQGTTSGAG